MEFKKKEALRFKALAEAKFEENNIKTASYLAAKAQMLNPDLKGILQLTEALSVVAISDETRSKEGEVDRYKVLGVDLGADYSVIRKQYKKLAYAIHPDRNKSVAALSAFKIVSEAWSFLSNKQERALYDERRKQKEIFDNVMLNNPSELGSSNGSKQSAYGIATSSQPSFWTVCTACGAQFEYRREYLNKHLRCLKCRGHFLAVAIPTFSSSLADENAVPHSFFQQKYGQYNSFGPPVSKCQKPADFSGVGATRNVYQGGLFTDAGAAMRPATFTTTDRWDWKRKYGTEGPNSSARGSFGGGVVPDRDALQKRKRRDNDQKKASLRGDIHVGFCRVVMSELPMQVISDQKKAALKGKGNAVFAVENVSQALRQKKVTFAFGSQRRYAGKASYRRLPKKELSLLEKRRILMIKTKRMIRLRIAEKKMIKTDVSRAQLESNEDC